MKLLLPLLQLAASAALVASATSCGEPRLSASDKCSDWQCSRVVYPKDALSSSPLRDGDNTNDGNGTYFGYGLCVRGLGEGALCNVDDDCFVKKYSCQNMSTTIVNGSTEVVTWAKQCVTKADAKVVWQGYVGVAVAVVGFGTNFVPAKQVRAGNGMLFQLAQCMGVIVAGIICALVVQQYTIYPMSLVGGLLWTLGNCLCVPIIQLVGLGIGLSVWGTTNMLVGWASGRFGFMGVAEEIAPTPWRSYVGVGVAVLAICAFASVKPTTGGAKKKQKGDDEIAVDNGSGSLDTVPLNGGAVDASYRAKTGATQHVHIYAEDEAIRRGQEEEVKKEGGGGRRALGLFLGIVAGVFFGLNFNPSQAMMDTYDKLTLEDASRTPSIHFSPTGVDYFFSFSLGVVMTSVLLTAMFYGAHTMLPKHVSKKVLPSLFNDMHLINFGEMLVPGIASGLIWSCAQIGWFVANTNLGLSVSFPLIGVGPSLVANAWGIFLFGEVEGKRNFMLLGLAFALVGVSCGFTVWAQSE